MSMEIILDPDVLAVIEFMQSRVRAARLVSVANAIGSLAVPLWGRYGSEEIAPLAVAPSLPAANGASP
jgi:hypothetical protein